MTPQREPSFALLLCCCGQIERVAERKGQTEYFVHWKGWNKKWDEWLGGDRVMPRNPETMRVMKDINAEVRERMQARSSRKTGSAASGGGAKGGKGGSDGSRPAKRRRVDPATETEEYPPGVIRLNLSFPLKKLLVDDWEWITRKEHLIRIPKGPPAAAAASNEETGDGEPVPAASFTVSRVLQEFMEFKQAQGQADRAMRELIDGLRLYFDRALPTYLLYRFERPQFEEYVQGRPSEDQRSMSEVYGAEHLLRLMVKLPSLLRMADLDAGDASVLQARLGEFLRCVSNRLVLYACLFRGQMLFPRACLPV